MGAGGGKGGGPASPDFGAMAERQAASGRINQVNPFGSVTWGGGAGGGQAPSAGGGLGGSAGEAIRRLMGGQGASEGGGGDTSDLMQTTELAPGLAAGAERLMGEVGSQGPLGTGDQARDQAIEATYGQMASRLDPQWAQRQSQIQSQLAGQGLDPGSEAYGQAMGEFGRGRNDAYQSALNAAVREGLGAQQVTFGQNLQSQMAPYRQLQAIQGLASGLTGQGRETQYLPAAMAAYQGALQQYGIQQQGKNSALGGLGDIGGSALPFAFI